jgi:hypothetical protein
MGMCAFAGAPYLVSPVTLNDEWLTIHLIQIDRLPKPKRAKPSSTIAESSCTNHRRYREQKSLRRPGYSCNDFG